MKIVAIVVTIAFLFIIVPTSYQISRDIDAVIDRAQVAASAEDMLTYVVQLKANMERLGMTNGHTAVFFTTPATDMALHYKTVVRIMERLKQVKDLPQEGTAYQVALSDLRGTLRELSNPAGGWIWSHYLWWMLLVAVFFWVIAAVTES